MSRHSSTGETPMLILRLKFAAIPVTLTPSHEQQTTKMKRAFRYRQYANAVGLFAFLATYTAIISLVGYSITEWHGVIYSAPLTILAWTLMLRSAATDPLFKRTAQPYPMPKIARELSDDVSRLETAALVAGPAAYLRSGTELHRLHARITETLAAIIPDSPRPPFPEPDCAIVQRGVGSTQDAFTRALWREFNAASGSLEAATNDRRPLTECELQRVFSTLIQTYSIICQHLGLGDDAVGKPAPITVAEIRPLPSDLQLQVDALNASIAELAANPTEISLDDRQTIRAMRENHLPTLLQAYRQVAKPDDIAARSSADLSLGSAVTILTDAVKAIRIHRDANTHDALLRATRFIELRYDPPRAIANDSLQPVEAYGP